MPKDVIFVNTGVSQEDELALRIIGGYLRKSRSDCVRQAIRDFIVKYQEVVQVTSLPRPKGGDFIPVVSVSEELSEGSNGSQSG